MSSICEAPGFNSQSKARTTDNSPETNLTQRLPEMTRTREVWPFFGRAGLSLGLHLVPTKREFHFSRFCLLIWVLLLPWLFFEASRSWCVGESSGLEEVWLGPNAG